MRIALVSPYSYTYPGGVGRHVEALAEELGRRGHDARILAPYDPDDRRARIMHRGARPEPRALPDNLVSLGRTFGLPMNGAVSNLTLAPGAFSRLTEELAGGGYDVVHVHEPNAPVVSWCATALAGTPLVGTFHAYATSPLSAALARAAGARRIYNRLHVRIAVSEAAKWTGERFYGGRYRVLPNGVDLAAAPAAPKPERDGEEVRLLFLGRAEERKGLPVLVRAFEALRAAGVPARLTVAGATEEEVRPFALDRDGIEVAGRVTEADKWRLLHEADVLCAPSLGGESFGMVLTEAFAAGTPVVCSEIAGYRDVVHHGEEGLLVPPGDPGELAEALLGLADDPSRRRRMGELARQSAERFAWPRVAAEVEEAYEDAISAAERAPATGLAAAAVRYGVRPADGLPARGPRRLPAPEPSSPAASAGLRRHRRARRIATATAGVAAAGLAGLAVHRIGPAQIGEALLSAAPTPILFALGLMCLSLLMRAEAWHAILRAALPGLPVRRADSVSGTMIGVLMSATLPARLGEPSRAFVVARRLGRVRERLPVVLGTLVSQTLLNLLALAVLGSVMIATVGLFRGNTETLLFATLAPMLIAALVVLAPALFRRDGADGRDGRARSARARALARDALAQLRSGLRVFRRPRLGAWAALSQLAAWAVQWLACYVLLVALGLDGHAGMGAAAAVLFAINVTAVLPATPSNIGVFQAACVAVLSAYGVGYTDALAYGIVLQAVEIATAMALGMPALLREGMSWRDMRVRALYSSPVELGVGGGRTAGAELEA